LAHTRTTTSWPLSFTRGIRVIDIVPRRAQWTAFAVVRRVRRRGGGLTTACIASPPLPLFVAAVSLAASAILASLMGAMAMRDDDDDNNDDNDGRRRCRRKGGTSSTLDSARRPHQRASSSFLPQRPIRPPPASAAAAVILALLDFDAFESSEITKDEKKSVPILSDDEALCRYGAPGKAMGEACDRAGKKLNLPSFVDATGKVDRVDYLRCRYEYPILGGGYVKTRVCKPS